MKNWGKICFLFLTCCLMSTLLIACGPQIGATNPDKTADPIDNTMVDNTNNHQKSDETEIPTELTSTETPSEENLPTEVNHQITPPNENQPESNTPTEPEPEHPTEPEPETPACEHNLGDWIVIKVPTCTEPGEVQRTCACGVIVETRSIEPQGHNYVYEDIPATCCQDGTHTTTCKNCNFKEVETIPASDKYHSFVYVKTIEPSCTEQGYMLYTCQHCHTQKQSNFTDPTGHTSYVGCVTAKATCCTPGIITYTCIYGDHSYTETIPATGVHEYTITKTIDPTCTTDGYTLHKCQYCNDSYIDNIKTHLGHDHHCTNTVPATCTEDGYNTYTCARCNDVYQETLTQLGHNHEHTATVPATCCQDGYHTSTCTRCGDIQTEIIEKSEEYHDYEITIITPTCTEDGYTLHNCRHCENSFKSDIIEKSEEYHDIAPDTQCCRHCHQSFVTSPIENFEGSYWYLKDTNTWAMRTKSSEKWAICFETYEPTEYEQQKTGTYYVYRGTLDNNGKFRKDAEQPTDNYHGKYKLISFENAHGQYEYYIELTDEKFSGTTFRLDYDLKQDTNTSKTYYALDTNDTKLFGSKSYKNSSLIFAGYGV